MKLTNPIDIDLNRAFAEKVAQITDIKEKCPWEKCSFPEGQLFGMGPAGIQLVPDYLSDANAVLPWLEKLAMWRTEGVAFADPKERYFCRCWIERPKGGGLDKVHVAFAETLPRAAVLALLAAHGVEIEFTK